jgi:hypothetical protein
MVEKTTGIHRKVYYQAMTGKAEKRISGIQGLSGSGDSYTFFNYYYFYFTAVRPRAWEV